MNDVKVRGVAGHYRTWPGKTVRKFQRAMLEWYLSHRRELPWRRKPTPYRVWVSEVMLQQTQVRTVIPYYDRFLHRFPDVESLADATVDEVLKCWAGLGYYSRARNLHSAAKRIAQDYGGRFPRRLEQLLGLPGVGRYTACAICSIALDQPHPLVDGNVRRVISRIHGLLKGAAESFFWEQAASWVPADRPADFNQALMELGALVCLPTRPRCAACPARTFCQAYKKRIQDRIPVARAKPKVEEIDIAALVIERGGRILVTSAQESSFVPGKWGLPWKVVGPSDSPGATARILARGLCRRLPEFRQCGSVRHSITSRRILVHVFHAHLRAFAPIASGGERNRWVDIQVLGSLLTSSLFRKVLRSALGASVISEKAGAA